ncbi:MAG: hypothetical protein ACHQRM_16455 [Bacteroidia bacterium]
MPEGKYLNNSAQKDYIRNKWVAFAKEIFTDPDRDFSILTFPAEAMQDLHLFKEEGLINWEEAESKSLDGSPNLRITKGNVRCFEKNPTIQRKLSQKLIEAKVEGDFSPYIAANYSPILSGRNKTFPVDVVNLDFDGRLQPSNKYPFDATIKCIFEFQKNHSRNFSLFLTWPVAEGEDLDEYKELINNVIESNLDDPSAVNFKTSFEADLGAIGNLQYEQKSIIGVAKIVIKKASQNLYTLHKNEFFVYGGEAEGRKRMISLLFNFKYDGRAGRENIIYANDVIRSLNNILDINNEGRD